jgi:hypothetical protein
VIRLSSLDNIEISLSNRWRASYHPDAMPMIRAAAVPPSPAGL